MNKSEQQQHERYKTVRWTIEEKKKIFHCFTYSRHEKWGRRTKAVFEERIKKEDLPTEKKEATTTAKLQSIASQITKYLTAEEIQRIKEDAQKEAIKDHQSMEEGKQLEFERSQWKREEEWVLLWAVEYAKAKYTNRKERCREWQRIFHHHCPSKKDIAKGRLTSQRRKFIAYKHFTDAEIQVMQQEVGQMVRDGICPLSQPIGPPRNDCPQKTSIQQRAPDQASLSHQRGRGQTQPQHNRSQTAPQPQNNVQMHPDPQQWELEKELANKIEEAEIKSRDLPHGILGRPKP
ncbi:uncharacterized protein LOC117530542 [Thalassophryne amazonica]|uniref:uncharacterized protein LOC117530542 n=1 Tax=Thalassophryne amazonica TaxID=390379 RepID=UPI001471B8DB|nr:uncharacterized protein LOC117530542 [Thalassophryne amazonica]